MKDSIRLHPEHGLNPAMVRCFWCGGDKNEIALLGLNKGKEAPRHVVTDYDPCDKCIENRALGITIIGVVDRQPEDQRPAIDDTHYPTGSWCVIKYEAAAKMLAGAPNELRESILSGGVMLMDQDELEQLTKPPEGDS